MKKITLFVAICFAFTACNFSAGSKKDLVSGLSVSYNGFTIGEAGLINDRGERTTINQVAVGKTIAIVVDDVSNYELKDGRAFPGLDLQLTDKDDVVVLEGKDILKDDAGYAPADASTIKGTITAGNPLKAGQTYHAKMHVYDKLKPKSEIDVKVDIIITE